ncbi:MAG: hypothetical protein U0457_11040 [Candidatus Sericytochromatia bacterium]
MANVPQRPQPAQPPQAKPQAQPAGGGGNSQGLTPDDLLARDFNTLAKPANLFRFRIDKDNVVIDFGYLPPIIQNEIDRLTKDVVNVHTRIAIQFELAKQMAEKLVETIKEAEEM